METLENQLLIPNIEEEIDPKGQFEYMRTIIRCSKTINMWPNEKKIPSEKFWYNFKVCVIILSCLITDFSVLMRIKLEYGNMDGVTEIIDFLTVLISATFRYIYIHVRGDEYLRLVRMMHSNFIHYTFFPSKNPACLHKYYTHVNRIALTYGCCTFIWIFQVCLEPMIKYYMAKNGSRLPVKEANVTEVEIPYRLVLGAYFPIDTTVQPTHGVIYTYQIFAFFVYGIIYVMVDCFWYMVISLTIGQFVLIKKSINTMADVLQDEESSTEIKLLKENEMKVIEGDLKKCIEHHQFLREFVRLIDDLINPNVLIDSLHAIISIAFILLDVSIALNKGDWNKVLFSLEYFLLSVGHMFFFDWLGNELAVKEEELVEAIYSISWYKCPMQKDNLLLVTILARRPHRLTGGKMYKLSLEFFTSMVRAIFSYFTFLFQLRNGKPQKVLR